MDYIGKYGEYRVLAKLFELKVEAYLAIKSNQDDFDITVITDDCRVVRVQVKTTTLWSESTNNSIAGIEKKYDFVVIVIVDRKEIIAGTHINGESEEQESSYEYIPHFFIMTKEEAMMEKGKSKNLGVSRQEKKIFLIKESLQPYKNSWRKITYAASIS